MTRFLLDTNILIDVSKGRQPASGVIARLLGSEYQLLTSPVVIGEFYTGAPRGRYPSVDAWLDVMSLVPLTRVVALLAGEHRYEQARTGRTISLADALIGAAAMASGCVLLTNNVRDFRQPGLEVVTSHALGSDFGTR